MNFKIVLAGLVLGASAVAFAGCGGNACDQLASDITAKNEECGVTGGSTSTGSGGECTDEAATLATCYSACLAAVDCDGYTGADVDKALDYATCLADCLGTGA